MWSRGGAPRAVAIHTRTETATGPARRAVSQVEVGKTTAVLAWGGLVAQAVKLSAANAIRAARATAGSIRGRRRWVDTMSPAAPKPGRRSTKHSGRPKNHTVCCQTTAPALLESEKKLPPYRWSRYSSARPVRKTAVAR